MRLKRVLMHGFTLTVINFVAIFLGHAAYVYLFNHHYQLHVQVPIALVLTVMGFLLWKLCVQISGKISLSLHGIAEYFGVYLAAFLWNPLLFIPAHRFLTGIFTEPSNIAGGWVFQLFANAVAIVLVGGVAHWGREAIKIAS